MLSILRHWGHGDIQTLKIILVMPDLPLWGFPVVSVLPVDHALFFRHNPTSARSINVITGQLPSRT